jgi:DNA-binding NarL/FixJ family response regulator
MFEGERHLLDVFVLSSDQSALEIIQEKFNRSVELRLAERFTSADAAIRMISRSSPNAILVDLRIPGIDCLRLIDATQGKSNAGVVWFVPSPVNLANVMSVTKHHLVLLSCSPRHLITVIRNAIATSTGTLPSPVEELFGFMRLPNVLSPAQLDVLIHRARGLSRKQVAAALSMSRSTVNTHCEKIFEKLGVHTANELTRYALHHRLI